MSQQPNYCIQISWRLCLGIYSTERIAARKRSVFLLSALLHCEPPYLYTPPVDYTIRLEDGSTLKKTTGRITSKAGLSATTGWNNSSPRPPCAAFDTRCHGATTTIARMNDYCKNTPVDPLFSHKCVEVRNELIRKNLEKNAELVAKVRA